MKSAIAPVNLIGMSIKTAKKSFYTTAEVAAILGVTDSRVRQILIDQGLNVFAYASKIGGIWLISSEQLPKLKQKHLEICKKKSNRV